MTTNKIDKTLLHSIASHVVVLFCYCCITYRGLFSKNKHWFWIRERKTPFQLYIFTYSCNKNTTCC